MDALECAYQFGQMLIVWINDETGVSDLPCVPDQATTEEHKLAQANAACHRNIMPWRALGGRLFPRSGFGHGQFRQRRSA